MSVFSAPEGNITPSTITRTIGLKWRYIRYIQKFATKHEVWNLTGTSYPWNYTEWNPRLDIIPGPWNSGGVARESMYVCRVSVANGTMSAGRLSHSSYYSPVIPGIVYPTGVVTAAIVVTKTIVEVDFSNIGSY